MSTERVVTLIRVGFTIIWLSAVIAAYLDPLKHRELLPSQTGIPYLLWVLIAVSDIVGVWITSEYHLRKIKRIPVGSADRTKLVNSGLIALTAISLSPIIIASIYYLTGGTPQRTLMLILLSFIAYLKVYAVIPKYFDALKTGIGSSVD